MCHILIYICLISSDYIWQWSRYSRSSQVWCDNFWLDNDGKRWVRASLLYGLQSRVSTHHTCEGNVLTQPPTGTGSHCFHFYMLLELCWRGAGSPLFVTSPSSSGPATNNQRILHILKLMFDHPPLLLRLLSACLIAAKVPSQKAEYKERQCQPPSHPPPP